MKNRGISLLLCLLLLASLTASAFAAEGDPQSNSGMVLDKTAAANADGSYTITLEAYATGTQVITTTQTEKPTDIILVLDQSGSMAYDMKNPEFNAYTGEDAENQELYDHRANGGDGNLWHRLEDGSHVSVNVTRKLTGKYTAYAGEKNRTYYSNRYNLYALIDGEYRAVNVSRTWVNNRYRYTYTLSDGRVLGSSDRADTRPGFSSNFYLYQNNQYKYTYTYYNAQGTEVLIYTKLGNDTEVDNPSLYERNFIPSGTTRLTALKNAVTAFANSVNTKAKGADGVYGTEDDVNHRIAVVGFASQSGYGNNTELLSIAGNNSGSVGVAYNSITTQNYKNVLQDMNTQAGYNMVSAAIGALAAEGATQVDLGMNMAEGILNNNPVRVGEQRNRVVVVFTDGSPTSSNTFDMTVANAAISKSNAIKGTGATVYAVGIFEGANTNTLGNQNGRTEAEKCNWFMHNLSSNNGALKFPSYYLSAADSGSLSGIFQQIASQVQQGGSTTTLDGGTVIKDIVAPSFTLPANATASDISLKTFACTGDNQWEENVGNAMGATAAVDTATNQVSVTGFNFAENYVSAIEENGTITGYRGHKLQISFTVQPKAGFLGGNNVPTNAIAGVYEDANAGQPLLTFPEPVVNVPIKPVTVTDLEENVYLLGSLTTDEMCKNASVGGVTLDLSKANDADNKFGLEPWQYTYVDIGVEYTNGEVPASFESLTEDVSYTTKVTVSPKPGEAAAVGTAATAQEGSGTVRVNVFKPEAEYQDISKWLGESVTTADITALTVVWKHGNETANPETMTGEAPTVDFSYTIGTTTLGSYTIGTTDDIPVNAAAKIGGTNINEHITYTWSRGSCPETETSIPTHRGNEDQPEFRVHVKTGTLVINKSGGRTGEGFVFNVSNGNGINMRVSCAAGGSVTITNLPKGTYTVTEETGAGGAWRYNYTVAWTDGNNAIDAAHPTIGVTVTNAQSNPYLLDGWAFAANNSVQQTAGQTGQ